MSLERALSKGLLDVGLCCVRANTNDLVSVLLVVVLVHIDGPVNTAETTSTLNHVLTSTFLLSYLISQQKSLHSSHYS
jgi:hypothetical protein